MMKNYEDLEKTACDSMACLTQAILEGKDEFYEAERRMMSAKQSLKDGIVSKDTYERILSEQNARKQQARETVLQMAAGAKSAIQDVSIEAFTPNLFSMTQEMALSLLVINLDVREAGHLIWDHLENFTVVRAVISSANRSGVVLESESDKLVDAVASITDDFIDFAVSVYETFEKTYPKHERNEKQKIEEALEKAQAAVSEAVKAYCETPFRQVF